MNKEPKPVTFAGTIDDIVREAVEGEKQRCMEVARTTTFDVCRPGRRVGDYIAEQIERSACATAPEPPAEEPMTIAIIKERLRKGDCTLSTVYHWFQLERDLTALVEARRKRDADLCARVGSGCNVNWQAACDECQRVILADLRGWYEHA